MLTWNFFLFQRTFIEKRKKKILSVLRLILKITPDILDEGHIRVHRFLFTIQDAHSFISLVTDLENDHRLRVGNVQTTELTWSGVKQKHLV